LLSNLATTAEEPQGKWYFLSGTSTEDTDRHFPAVLYGANLITKKLNPIRQVVAGDDGVHSILQYDSTIFVNYPNLPPTTVSVIHSGNPSVADEIIFNPEGKKDKIVFNPKGRVLIDTKLAIAESNEGSLEELMWLVSGPEDRSGGVVISVAQRSSERGERIQRGAWQEYSSLRFEGYPGGPAMQPALVGSLRDNTVGITVSGKYVIVDRLSDDIVRNVRGESLHYFAVTNRYLIFAIPHRLEELQSGAVAKEVSHTAYVHDRQTNRWTAVSIDGSCSRTRIFGPWLASIVQFWHPNHPPNPGASNERNVETDTLPNVREMYAMFAGQNCFIPGDLALHNLRTGQTIAFHTGQEDSEILRVEGETVLYRVNDTIYQAKIGGDQLKDATVVVKDEDVPEIHWAFWSK